MKILVVNCGSSSVKCDLYDMKELPETPVAPMWYGRIEWKGEFDQPSLIVQDEFKPISAENRRDGIKEMLLHLDKICKLSTIEVVGHRVVHGGKAYHESVEITPKVKVDLQKLSELAPLHNPASLEGIDIMEALCSNAAQVAVFDTAFHHTLPLAAKVYPIPYHFYEEGIQRYGFHGISFQYCSRRAANLVQREMHGLKMVICHLGAGASLCAVVDGKSIDTTMGFTPLEGVMMDTRSGSIDPGILLYLLKERRMGQEELTRMLYHQSGLLGVSGLSGDMRDIITAASQKSESAHLAFEVYIKQLNRMIGAMIASLQGIDLLVFTAGIGENAALLRQRVCESFSFVGLRLDEEKNYQVSKSDRIISHDSSAVNVLVVHTRESFEIACRCYRRFLGI